MKVLAVDTCLEPGSAALLCPGSVSEVVPLPPGWRSVALHEEIARLLARHGLTTADITLFAVTAGPGAFTGVRLGLTAVKGLAEVHNRPVLAVSTLEALAAAAKNSDKWQVTSDQQEQITAASLVTPHSSLVTAFVPLLDARRGQIFGAVYRVEGTESTERAEFRPLLPETVCSLRSFLSQMEAAGLKAVRFCVIDEALLLPAIEGTVWSTSSFIRVSPHLAGAVAQMAVARFEQGRGSDALVVDANYVRASDAELFWKE